LAALGEPAQEAPMSNAYAATPPNAMRVSIVLTFGLALLFLPPLYPFVAFFYNGLTVSGARMATPGMRAMDLEMRMHETGARVPFVNAAVQAVLFYVSWCFPPIFLVSLVDVEKRCLHDIIAGVVIVRRL
jgi:uncharacterized RDD family membrane protein YckC